MLPKHPIIGRGIDKWCGAKYPFWLCFGNGLVGRPVIIDSTQDDVRDCRTASLLTLVISLVVTQASTRDGYAKLGDVAVK